MTTAGWRRNTRNSRRNSSCWTRRRKWRQTMKIPDDRYWHDPPEDEEENDDFLDRADIEHDERDDDGE